MWVLTPNPFFHNEKTKQKTPDVIIVNFKFDKFDVNQVLHSIFHSFNFFNVCLQKFFLSQWLFPKKKSLKPGYEDIC